MMKRAFTSEAVYEPKAICIHQLGRLSTGESVLFYNKKELQGLKWSELFYKFNVHLTFQPLSDL